MKTTAYAALLLGFGILVVGLSMWWRELAPTQSVHLVQNSVHVGVIPIDGKTDIAIRVANASSQTHRLVGVLDEAC